MSKRIRPLEEPESTILEKCINSGDAWTAVETFLSVLDMMVMFLISTSMRDFFKFRLAKRSGAYYFYFLEACKPCGSRNWLHNCLRSNPLGGGCVNGVRVKDNQTKKIYKHRAIIITGINHFYVDEESGEARISILLKEAFNSNWGRGVTMSISRYILTINLKTLKMVTSFVYEGEVHNSNGILHGTICHIRNFYGNVDVEECVKELDKIGLDLLRPILNSVEVVQPAEKK